MDLIEKSKQNRHDFLEPYQLRVVALQKQLKNMNDMKEGFDRAKGIRKAKGEIEEIIIYLLKIEPSHIREDWIQDIMENWRAEGKELVLSGRGVAEPFTSSEARLELLYFEIRRYNERMKATFGPRNKRKRGLDYAIEHVWEDWNERHPKKPISFDYLRRKFFENNEPELPWPYWLRDIRPEAGGTYEIRGRGIIEIIQ